MGKKDKESRQFEPIDLSSLESIDIEPAWAKKNPQPNYEKRDARTDHKGKNKGKSEKSSGPRKRFSRPQSRRKPEDQFTFSIQPKGEVLQKIKEEMRRTGVSFGLSEICDTISSNPQRYNVIIRFADEKGGRLFATSKIDKKIFSSKEKAVEHLFANHSTKVFASEVELETNLNGNLPYIYECPKTKTLLPPNSYHYHEEVVRQHLLLNGISTNFKSYSGKLIKIDDAERIAEWVQKPLQVFRFAMVGAESVWYKSTEQLKRAFTQDPPTALLKVNDYANVSGDSLARAEPDIADQFKVFFRQKSKWLNGLFSSCLINLKKSNFTIFKFSEKKRTFASAHKRSRAGDTPLSKTSERVVTVMAKLTEIKKSALLNHEELKEIGKKNLLIELKWLTREGFVTEFSNGLLILN
jgi:hypothetical protein